MGDMPPDFTQMIHESQRLRGWIANAYAQIEFLLGDLIYRLKDVEAYQGLLARLPHGAPDRVKKVRALLKASGPLAVFRDTLEALLSGFEQSHETRNLLAHGFCEFLYTPTGDMGLNFRKWHRDSERGDVQIVRCFRLTDLQREEEQLVALSKMSLELFHDIHKHFGWA